MTAETIHNQTLTGLLFSRDAAKGLRWSDLPGVSSTAAFGTWDLIRLRTEYPLLPAEDPEKREYSYAYLARVHGEHGIFVSSQRHLVDVFLRVTGFHKAIRRPTVAVDRLVKALSARPHPIYTLSRVYAEVEGYGRRLRTMSLFGDNLIDVPTFQELLPLLTAQRAELRHVSSRRNVLCVDKAGEVDFFFRDPSSLKLMLDALSFLSTGIAKYTDEAGKELTEDSQPFISW